MTLSRERANACGHYATGSYSLSIQRAHMLGQTRKGGSVALPLEEQPEPCQIVKMVRQANTTAPALRSH